MRRKQNNRLEIGLDTLTLDIPTEYELLENAYDFVKYSLQGTTQGNGLTGGVPPVRFSM